MNENTTAPGVELPQYRCHKVVRAAKITGLQFPSAEVTRLVLGSIGGAIDVSHSWLLGKHAPGAADGFTLVGGYYVVYVDGYASFSPAKAFEAGYSLI